MTEQPMYYNIFAMSSLLGPADSFLPCSTLCDPYLNLFRGIIPPLNGTIDLSPILAFIALDVSLPASLCCIRMQASHNVLKTTQCGGHTASDDTSY